tara:strand:- start:2765 stop:4150 length:1386 start_codon:yes stop_codon:yes gene_type:complete
MTQYINTIKDLEARTYGLSPVGSNQLLKGAGIVGGLVTGHDSAIGLNGTAGPNLSALYNKIYGQKVWSMINQEINPLSVLPKRQYTQSGWRIMTRRPLGGANPAFGIGTTAYSAGSALNTPHADEIGGVQENHALDSTGLQSVAPEYDTLFMSPKTVAHQFAYSELAAEMAKIDDGIGDLRAIVREDMGKLHAEVQSKMLVMPLENYDLDSGGSASASGTQTYADMERNYTSLHKIISTSSEIHELATQNIIASANGAGASTDIGSLYGNTDRTASTAMGSSVGFMDATINIGDGYAATEQRTLTLSILNALIQQLRLAGGTPKVILTGFDTIQSIADLLQAQERFIDGKEIIPTHAGVKGVKGQEVGFRVATYMDIPMIPCKDMPITTHDTLSTGVSDMLFLDTDHLWFATLKPTQYFEDGINHGNPFGVGTLGNKGMFRTMGEVGCSFFKGQGKITNIK